MRSFKHKPNYMLLRSCGCRCYPWLKPYTTNKLQPRSIVYVFLGYQPSIKGYRCLDPITEKIYISKHVVFDESSFPLQSSSQLSSSETSASLQQFFWSLPFSSSHATANSAAQPASFPSAVTHSAAQPASSLVARLLLSLTQQLSQPLLHLFLFLYYPQLLLIRFLFLIFLLIFLVFLPMLIP